jgi:hypothetical protein
LTKQQEQAAAAGRRVEQQAAVFSSNRLCFQSFCKAYSKGFGESGGCRERTGLRKSCRTSKALWPPSATQPLVTEQGSTLRCWCC